MRVHRDVKYTPRRRFSWKGVNGRNVPWNKTKTKCTTVLIPKKKKNQNWFWGISLKWGIIHTNHTRTGTTCNGKKWLEGQSIQEFSGERPYKITSFCSSTFLYIKPFLFLSQVKVSNCICLHWLFFIKAHEVIIVALWDQLPASHDRRTQHRAQQDWDLSKIAQTLHRELRLIQTHRTQ